ncbi:MAG TPA: hypothetical protein VGP72_17825 [Planctomycetota bacterium]|jgi:flavin-dependent dehydrogenase
MEEREPRNKIVLEDGSTIAVIGGGPAGAFFAIHFLRRARELRRKTRVVILERRLAPCRAASSAPGVELNRCGYSAGGISPLLNDALRKLNLRLPPEVVEGHIHSITVQGYWKNIELVVPEDREIVSVSRGGLFVPRQNRSSSFDAFLLDCAVKEGAELVSGAAYDAYYAECRKPVVCYRCAGAEHRLEADFVVFAGGVNSGNTSSPAEGSLAQLFRRLNPAYALPRLRQSLIFELATMPETPIDLEGELHFVEYGSKALRLEMCSLLPKRGAITVVLVGPSVDASTGAAENQALIRHFLELPHISALLARTKFRLGCLCNPRLVIGAANHPFAERTAAVGDMVASRLYKDGLRSAHETACVLAEALLTRSVDEQSLHEAYAPLIRRFRRDNRFAALVFYMHRVVFGSSVLSRILYQAVITERKDTLASQRRLESILWKIASGDDEYPAIFRMMMTPATLWRIFTGGALVTLRNYLTELFFGLKWEGFGRFTTGVAKEQFEIKRAAFARMLAETGVAVPSRPEFERMYTIRIRASQDRVWNQLGRFGEADRGYCLPRWVEIQRISGTPNEPGCVIRYRLKGSRLAFSLELERIAGSHLAVYRVRDGFARGGVLLFEIEPTAKQSCNLSIYVAFALERGRTWVTRPLWWAFRALFPSFAHDVIWNQSLCQLKQLAEEQKKSFPPDD